MLLGPSVLGLISPAAEQFIFPSDLRPVLYVVGQIGLVLFMFQAGYEFRTDRIRYLARSATAISAAGILAPLALGVGLTWIAHDKVDAFPPSVSPVVSALFVGVALAITAFPMMARIITERGLSESRFGSLALASGALDDAIAWILLAGVLSLAAGSSGPFAVAVGGSAALVLVLIWIARTTVSLRFSSEHIVLFTLVMLFLAAWYTDKIGLYAVFGAFSLGAVYPRSASSDQVIETISPLSRVVFLPLFFTYSGLNTDFGLLIDPALLLFAVACVVAAVVGKFGACWAAARLVGESPAIAVRIGTLMNARGLMQLIALNVGLAAGIVSSELFTVLVLVALVTTLLATPLLSWWDRRDRRKESASDDPALDSAL